MGPPSAIRGIRLQEHPAQNHVERYHFQYSAPARRYAHRRRSVVGIFSHISIYFTAGTGPFGRLDTLCTGSTGWYRPTSDLKNDLYNMGPSRMFQVSYYELPYIFLSGVSARTLAESCTNVTKG